MDSETLVQLPQLGLEARSPPKAATLLVPVWGYRFIVQFLEFCLPTLLAPGNIPAVASALPTRFVVLSREGDEELIRSHPTWIALQKFCSAEIVFIDDLITDGNHTATITLAFARTVRQAQEAMTDTCFVFLMSDYLMADGSLRTLVSHFLNGASGVVAGNFQIVAEEAAPELQDNIDKTSRAIILPARDLLAWSLDHLHPATIANFVNSGPNHNFRTHNFHTNRLLWRVDEHTVIGRFYLMHPIGVRPEVTDFVVGSSLDYSFIPEMCPSGNVVTLTDSDDYFVIEMQPRRHERANLRAGPIQEGELAVSLVEWTTIQHRANIAQTVVYHSAEIPQDLGEVIAAADTFINRVSTLLSPYSPQPFRNHPYWIGSIASHRMQTGQALDREDWRFLLGQAVPSAGMRGRLWRVRRAIFGTVPEVTRFHTRWPDYNMPREALRQVVSNNGRLLLVADQPSRFAHWVTAMTNDVFTLEWDRLLAAQPSRALGEMPGWYRSLAETFDACLVVVTEPMLDKAGGAMERLGPLIKLQGQISIMILNDRPYHDAAAFSQAFARSVTELLDGSSWLTEVRYIPTTRLRWLVYRMTDAVLEHLRQAYMRSSIILPVWGGLAIALGPITYLVNLRVRSTVSPPSGLWSSVFLMLRRTRRDSREALNGAVASWQTPRSNNNAGTECSETDDGSRKLPASATVAENAIRQSATILKAHEFVARLLAGRHDMAIYGFDETDSISLTAYNVRRLTIYNPSSDTVSSRHHVAGASLHEAKFHDILGSPLPRVHDSISSLHTLAYIAPADEDACIEHFARSLARSHDILILGCPCNHTAEEITSGGRDTTNFVARHRALPHSARQNSVEHGATVLNRPAHRSYHYLRTGALLKASTERYFDNVFLFSIVDNALHVGPSNSADYVLAVCCNRKD